MTEGSSNSSSSSSLPHFFSQISPLYPSPTSDGKLDTVEFLEATKSFIKMYDLLGTTFYVVKRDMSGNVDKLYKTYNKDPEKYKYLNDLIYGERSDPHLYAVEALLWLKRAMEFTVIFIHGIAEKHHKGVLSDRLDHIATEAYSQTLKPYHMWLVQNLFKIVVKSVPNRSELVRSLYFGKTGSDELLSKDLLTYLKQLETNLSIIVQMYDKWGLNNDRKV